MHTHTHTLSHTHTHTHTHTHMLARMQGLLRADPASLKPTDILREAGINFDPVASTTEGFTGGSSAGVRKSNFYEN